MRLRWQRFFALSSPATTWLLAGAILLGAPQAGLAGAPKSEAKAGPRVEVREIGPIMADVRKSGGKPVLVNVWATWCEPCKEEMPDLLRFYRAYKPKGLRLVLISADPADARQEVSQYLASVGVDFSSYLKTGKDMAFINALDPAWDGTIPATVLFDGAGKRYFLWSGKVTFDTLKQKFEELLQAPHKAPKKKGNKP